MGKQIKGSKTSFNFFVDYSYLEQFTRRSLQGDPVKETIITELNTVLALAQQNHRDIQMILRELQSKYNRTE